MFLKSGILYLRFWYDICFAFIFEDLYFWDCYGFAIKHIPGIFIIRLRSRRIKLRLVCYVHIEDILISLSWIIILFGQSLVVWTQWSWAQWLTSLFQHLFLIFAVLVGPPIDYTWVNCYRCIILIRRNSCCFIVMLSCIMTRQILHILTVFYFVKFVHLLDGAIGWHVFLHFQWASFMKQFIWVYH